MNRSKKREFTRVPLPAALPNVHALMALGLANAFETIRVAASIWDPMQWHAVHVPTVGVVSFEFSHGKEPERYLYNDRSIAEVQRTGKAVLGQHAGVCDFFVPIRMGSGVHAVLVVGPFLTERPTSSELSRRWRAISGRQAHLSDPESLNI